MKPNNNKTVLFIFSLSAKKEAERKPLFGYHKKRISEQFFKNQNNKTLAIAKQSGIDVVWLDETKQKGANFSERFSNAFSSLFKQGYDKVISIGNDTPNLTTKHIKEAIHLLSKQQMVLGPSKDGGVYLLGYTKAIFDETIFKKISWLTSEVFTEIKDFAIARNINFSSLETLIDLDTKSNALEFAYLNPTTLASAYILSNLVAKKNRHQQTFLSFLKNIGSFTFLLRGPPSLQSS